jgi:hypothetical protein
VTFRVPEFVVLANPAVPVNVGLPANTAEPVPVSSVRAVDRLEEVNDPREATLPTDVIIPVRFAFVVTFEDVPVRLAVIFPAEKLPELSRATIVDAVFTFVASVPRDIAADPLYAPPVKCVPGVSEYRFDPKATPEMVELASCAFGRALIPRVPVVRVMYAGRVTDESCFEPLLYRSVFAVLPLLIMFPTVAVPVVVNVCEPRLTALKAPVYGT